MAHGNLSPHIQSGWEEAEEWPEVQSGWDTGDPGEEWLLLFAQQWDMDVQWEMEWDVKSISGRWV